MLAFAIHVQTGLKTLAIKGSLWNEEDIDERDEDEDKGEISAEDPLRSNLERSNHPNSLVI